MSEERTGKPKTDLERRMLYEECSLCDGTGRLTDTHRLSGDRDCVCVPMRVIITGLTVWQTEQMVSLDTLRQEAGISAAMLRDGRAAAFRDMLGVLKQIVTMRDGLGMDLTSLPKPYECFDDWAADLAEAAITKATKGEP